MARIEIDAKTWARLNELLDEALEQSAATRESWLASLDPQYATLMPQLRDLLSRSHAIETDDFLRTLPRIDVGAEPAESVLPGGAGEIVGAYRLVREIGSGGMGSVWLAERADGLFTRPVALKLPHLFGRQAGLAERMAREREILATLDHPHIAKLFDAGITVAGQPYLALEYVEGAPLDEYLERETAASPRSRLRLFLQVANAVAYAHGKLVIHRDLKPANILVTAAGEIRLLDFGIAKLLDADVTNAGQLTELSGRAFTPDYASPEQILGESLGVASDVYSLGVIFYELLSGDRPYKLRRDSRAALEEAIVQAEPAPLPRALRGDLETIAQKALKKQPGERYATVNEFTDDIVRYLGHRPVLARPASRGYRLRKFMVRNRTGVGVTALILATTFVGAGLAIWQARIAVAERDRAESVKDLVTSMFVNADPYANGGNKLSAADVLLQAEREYRARPVRDPRVRIEIAYVLAGSLFRLNEDETSERLATEALVAARRLLPATDPTRLRLTILSAEQHRFRGKVAPAQELIDEALVPLRAGPPSMAADFVHALLVKSDIAIDANESAAAIALAHEALERGRRSLPARDGLIIRALTALSAAQHSAGDDTAALASARESVEAARGKFGERGHDPLLLDARVMYSKALGGYGRFAEAADELEAVIRDASELHGSTSVEVGMYLQNVAGLQLRAGRISAGIDSAARALAIRGPAVDPDSFESLATRDVYARGLLLGRRAADALPVLEGMQEGMVKLLGPDHPRVLESRANLALATAWAGKLVQAREQADDVVVAAKKAGRDATYRPLHVRAVVASLSHDFGSAANFESQALELDSARRNPVDHAEVLCGLGSAELAGGNLPSAERHLRASLQLLDDIGHTSTPLRAEVLTQMAQLQLAQGRPRDALVPAGLAAAFWKEFDPDSRGAAQADYWLARVRAAGR